MFPGLVLTNAQLREAVRRLQAHGEFVLDVETVGDNRLNPLVNDVRWIGLATHGFSCAIPMGHPNGDRVIAPAARRKNPATGTFATIPARYEPPPPQLPRHQVFETLWPLLSSDRRKIGSNVLIDLASVTKYLPAPPAPPFADTIGAATVLNENIRNKGLKALTLLQFGVVYDKHNTGKEVEKYPLSQVGAYNWLDCCYTWLLWLNEKSALSAQGLGRVFEVECELLESLLLMKLRGAPVDENALRDLDVALSTELALLEKQLYAAVGYEFNLNSPQQKSKVLYAPAAEGGQGLRPTMLTKGARERESR